VIAQGVIGNQGGDLDAVLHVGRKPLFAGDLRICDRVDIKAVEQFVFYGKRAVYSAVKLGVRRHFRT
jgi:hypothetical protein